MTDIATLVELDSLEADFSIEERNAQLLQMQREGVTRKKYHKIKTFDEAVSIFREKFEIHGNEVLVSSWWSKNKVNGLWPFIVYRKIRWHDFLRDLGISPVFTEREGMRKDVVVYSLEEASKIFMERYSAWTSNVVKPDVWKYSRYSQVYFFVCSRMEWQSFCFQYGGLSETKLRHYFRETWTLEDLKAKAEGIIFHLGGLPTAVRLQQEDLDLHFIISKHYTSWPVFVKKELGMKYLPVVQKGEKS